MSARRSLLVSAGKIWARPRPRAPKCTLSTRSIHNGTRVLVRQRGIVITQHCSIQSRQWQFWEARGNRGLATETIQDGAFATEHDFHVVADETLDKVSDVVEQLEEHLDDFESNLSQGVLNLQLGPKGTWVLNKQAPNMQIWWSSPISGPLRFEYHGGSGEWKTTRDGRELFALLIKEVKEVTGVTLEL